MELGGFMRRTVISISLTALVAAAPAAWADGDHGGHHGAAPPDDRYECPVNEHTSEPTGLEVFEERHDYETGRKECVVFYANPFAPDADGDGSPDSDYGSWDPATEDDDPSYSPGDRGMRWGWNKQGPERGGADDHHYAPTFDPECSQAAQDELRQRARDSLARYDGFEGIAKAQSEGYVFYPIAWKTYHAFNTSLYDDVDPATGQQADIVPELPENIVYAMTDDGPKAMGIMFALGQDEANARSWKDADPSEYPNFVARHPDPVTGAPEQCRMHWHSHTGAEGVATSFDPQNPEESVPMAHVWAWGLPMWDAGADGSEASAWWLPYRILPSICSEKDACL